jgi:hypothetical protein
MTAIASARVTTSGHGNDREARARGASASADESDDCGAQANGTDGCVCAGQRAGLSVLTEPGQ